MNLLLERGADVHSKDGNSNTALHWVVGRGNLSMVATLMEAGVDLQAKNSAGATALHKACSNGRLVVVQKLVSSKADMDAQDSEGNTALHLAAAADFGFWLSISACAGHLIGRPTLAGPSRRPALILPTWSRGASVAIV